MSKRPGLILAVCLGMIVAAFNCINVIDLSPSTLPTSNKSSLKSKTENFYYFPFIAQSECNGYKASLDFTPGKIKLSINETLTVTAILRNNGCSELGLPTYQIQPQLIEHLVPMTPTLQIHYLAILPGQTDKAQFFFMTKSTGQVMLEGVAGFEVNLKSGPPIWGHVVSKPITITIQQP